jgi:hypothetical protein
MVRRLRILLADTSMPAWDPPSKSNKGDASIHLAKTSLLLVTTYGLHYQRADGYCISSEARFGGRRPGLSSEAAHMAAFALSLSHICNINLLKPLITHRLGCPVGVAKPRAAKAKP